MAKILIVEDDEESRRVLYSFLIFDNHRVESLSDGLEASEHLKAFGYDLVILDWDLPGTSGFEICRNFRLNGGKAPILMLTGKSSLDDKEAALDSGADDYLTKPFELRELGARVRALLRRPGVIARKEQDIGGLVLDPGRMRVTKDGQHFTLLPKEFQLLEFLMRHPNQVFTNEAILNNVWPSDADASPEAIRSTIKRLRKKIDPDGNLIRTMHGVGYIFQTD